MSDGRERVNPFFLGLREHQADSHLEEEEDDILVVGIDFGTTYSGVAWATKAEFDKREQINLITSWPGSGREEGKAPSDLYYDDGIIKWGFDIENSVDPIQWFKLLFLRDEDVPPEPRYSEFLLRARRMMRENGKTPISLISDYLHKLWTHILETIGKDLGETTLDALQIHIVITIPAIWKGYARQSMEDAAKAAGLLDRRRAGPTQLTFAPEPEVAALSTLCEPGRRIRPGDVYLICDAGGGTVDLITYVIGAVNPILMHEAVEGSGGLCGSIFVDEAFERILKNRLGRIWDGLSKAGVKDIMKGVWEQDIKRQFDPTNTTREYIVPIPAEAFGNENLTDMTKEPYIKNGRIHFKSSHIEKAFIGVFAYIDKLIEGQMSKSQASGFSLTGIILVGGLGGSPYLYQHLKMRHTPAKINILQSSGIRPRTAICRGAIYRGFLDDRAMRFGDHNTPTPIQVTSTISRASYGINYEPRFDEDVHLSEDKDWESVEGKWIAKRQMEWYLKRGDNVSKMNPISRPWYIAYKEDFGGTFRIDLYQCEDETPPTRKTASVKSIGSIECILDIPFSELEDAWDSGGGRIKKMRFEIAMIPAGASVEFIVTIDGRRLGTSHTIIQFK